MGLYALCTGPNLEYFCKNFERYCMEIKIIFSLRNSNASNKFREAELFYSVEFIIELHSTQFCRTYH